MGKLLFYFLATVIFSVCFLMFYDSKIRKSAFEAARGMPFFGGYFHINRHEDVISSLNELEDYSYLSVYKLCMITTEEDEERRASGFMRHGFNEFVSDRIGLLRNVPDTRNSLCKLKQYRQDLPTASIVMCFHNEAWSTLLRSVHNLLQKTPDHLLKDIILFDDNSSQDELGDQLEEYVRDHLPKAKLVRSKERLGLIRARIAAAKHATGKVLVFLDSHVEAVDMWLEPLLDRIAHDRTTVVVPIVDTIEPETLVFTAAKLVRGGFTWSLLHNWEPLPEDTAEIVSKTADPFMSPTMPGGLFAIDKKYFYELGEYDAGMDIWGGENVELSFRIWLCNGRLEIVPCSRVGHVFRKFRPYSSPDGRDTTLRNTARVAEVWLDEYKKHYYDVMPKAKTEKYGDVTDRIKLRQSLNCKSFKWFLENVHPEQAIPGERSGKSRRPRNEKKEVIIAQGQLKHNPSGLCVQPVSDPPVKEDRVALASCKTMSQTFIMTGEKVIKLQGSRLCLEAFTRRGRESSDVKLSKCHNSGGDQLWLVVRDLGPVPVLYNPAAGKCLAVQVGEKNQKLRMDLCSSGAAQGFEMSGLSDEHFIIL